MEIYWGIKNYYKNVDISTNNKASHVIGLVYILRSFKLKYYGANFLCSMCVADFKTREKSLNGSLREKCPNTEFFSGPYFPVFGLNTEIYSANICIQSEYRKIRVTKIFFVALSKSHFS